MRAHLYPDIRDGTNYLQHQRAQYDTLGKQGGMIDLVQHKKQGAVAYYVEEIGHYAVFPAGYFLPFQAVGARIDAYAQMGQEHREEIHREQQDNNHLPGEAVHVGKEEKAEEERAGKNFIKTFRTEYKISIIINLVLIIAVIAMFVITLKADNPNMINYRTAIVNQYSEWQQELEQREEAVRAKERELNMSEFTE